MKKEEIPSFADYLTSGRKVKMQFFNQINNLVDWRPITTLINRHYTKGMSATGKPAYHGLLLFKMSLLQTWYGLSDYEIEDRLNDSISFSRFCGLQLNESSPDHSTLSRFRSIMTQTKAYDKIMKNLNKQLEAKKIIVKTGVIVDASIIDSPLKPKGQSTYEIEESLQEEGEDENKNKSDNQNPQKTESAPKMIKKVLKPGVDDEGSWVKKAGKLRFGYKKHTITDEQGMILGLVTTKASVNEISNLEEVLESTDLPAGTRVSGDKGYQSEKNATLLKSKNLKNQILKKAKKNKALTKWELKFNKIIGQTRYKIERTFGSIKRWFNGGVARYRGIAKMHTQNLMESMAYNLYRSPGIIMPSGKI